MPTLQAAGGGPALRPSLTPAQRPSHGLTVLGWVVACFATIPVIMGSSGDGRAYLWAGLIMLVVGVAMILIGRRLGRPGQS
ncbi:MAG: hypothetical protein MUC56_00350 [Thermoanaerobaculales bacterium]|jgi:hypothetical protein|nr:hypothetical protein [Thermoanaerobaculales bacterium]